MTIFSVAKLSWLKARDAQGHASARQTILLVDDEPANLNVLELMLATEFDVLCAGSGEEAIRILSGSPCAELACVVADYKMPGMSGIELLGQVFRMLPHVEGILVSGCIQLGTDLVCAGRSVAVLEKPFDIQDLQDLIRRCLAPKYAG